MNNDSSLAGLHRELAALKARVAILEAQCAPGGAITCSAITVVDAQKQPVALIDATGLLQCQRIHVEKPGMARWLAYDAQFGELVIAMPNPAGGPPVRLVVLNEAGLGRIALKAPPASKTQSFVRLTPDGEGGRMELGDRNGKTICDATVSAAGSTWTLKSKDPQQGSVNLGVDGSGNGKIVVADANGTTSGTLP